MKGCHTPWSLVIAYERKSGGRKSDQLTLVLGSFRFILVRPMHFWAHEEDKVEHNHAAISQMVSSTRSNAYTLVKIRRNLEEYVPKQASENTFNWLYILYIIVCSIQRGVCAGPPIIPSSIISSYAQHCAYCAFCSLLLNMYSLVEPSAIHNRLNCDPALHQAGDTSICSSRIASCDVSILTITQ